MVIFINFFLVNSAALNFGLVSYFMTPGDHDPKKSKSFREIGRLDSQIRWTGSTLYCAGNKRRGG